MGATSCLFSGINWLSGSEIAVRPLFRPLCSLARETASHCWESGEPERFSLFSLLPNWIICSLLIAALFCNLKLKNHTKNVENTNSGVNITWKSCCHRLSNLVFSCLFFSCQPETQCSFSHTVEQVWQKLRPSELSAVGPSFLASVHSYTTGVVQTSTRKDIPFASRFSAAWVSPAVVRPSSMKLCTPPRPTAVTALVLSPQLHEKRLLKTQGLLQLFPADDLQQLCWSLCDQYLYVLGLCNFMPQGCGVHHVPCSI